MTNPGDKRLLALSQIAKLKSDKAIADLAQAQAALDQTASKIKALEEDVRLTLRDANDPVSARLAITYATLKSRHQSELLAQLARCELHRKTCLKIAQQDEGRRIVLNKLNGQVS